MRVVRSLLHQAQKLNSPHKIRRATQQWKHRLVRTLWLKYGHIARRPWQPAIEKSLRKGKHQQAINLLRPHYNCELPASSFKMFMADLRAAKGPEEWEEKVFGEHRDRLMRFRPDRQQTEEFLKDMEQVLNKPGYIPRRQEKLKALKMIRAFNQNPPSLCLEGQSASVMAFNLALRIYEPGLLTAQSRLPVRSDPGFTGTGLCGPVAMMSLLCHEQPVRFTQFALKLISKGKAKADGFKLKVPSVVRAIPEYLDILSPLDRAVLGSFIPTTGSFGEFKGVYVGQLKKWFKAAGWKDTSYKPFSGKMKQRIRNRAKVAESLKKACAKGPAVIFGDSGMIFTLPERSAVNQHEAKPDGVTVTKHAHYTSVLDCTDLGKERLELKVINYGRIYKLHITKADLSRVTDGIIALGELE